MLESVNRRLTRESVPAAGLWVDATVFASSLSVFRIRSNPTGGAETLERSYHGPSSRIEGPGGRRRVIAPSGPVSKSDGEYSCRLP